MLLLRAALAPSSYGSWTSYTEVLRPAGGAAPARGAAARAPGAGGVRWGGTDRAAPGPDGGRDGRGHAHAQGVTIACHVMICGAISRAGSVRDSRREATTCTRAVGRGGAGGYAPAAEAAAMQANSASVARPWPPHPPHPVSPIAIGFIKVVRGRALGMQCNRGVNSKPICRVIDIDTRNYRRYVLSS